MFHMDSLRPRDTMDELDERREGRIVATMAVSIEYQVSYVLVTVQFQHAAEVGVFLRAAAHFHVALACRQQDWWQIGRSDVVQRGEFIARRLCHGNALFGANREMRDALAAQRHEPFELRVIATVAAEILRVHADHRRQIGACGMS